VWTRLIALDPTSLWTPEDIERAFPAVAQQSKGNGSGASASGGNGGAAAPVSSSSPTPTEADIPSDTMRVIRDGPTKGNARDRSLAFFNVMIVLKELGFTVEGILELLERYPEGVAKKYEGRLRREIERTYDKIDVTDMTGPPQAAAVSASVPMAVPAPVLASAPSPLDGVHAGFKNWLGKDYDTDMLDVVLAAGAAERLTGDPLWLMVISGSGNAKTETVQALEGAGALVTSAITSEGALLSATPRQLQGGRATGGLLLKLGARGVLVIKDVTSILSMDKKARGLVLAALREIYDGKWERNVGTGGGRTLLWNGRIAIVGACTTAWDTAHSVIAIMGDRFVIVRSDSETDQVRTRSAWQAIRNTGKETAMRTELATAVGGLHRQRQHPGISAHPRRDRPLDQTRQYRDADGHWRRARLQGRDGR